MLNNRELASAIILFAAIALVCSTRGGRRGLFDVLKAAFAPKLCILWSVYVAAVGGAEYGLLSVGLRYDGSIKDAVVWGLIAGLPIYVKFDKAAKEPGLLSRALLDALRVTALVEFFVNLYVFPLWVEIPVQLVLLFIGLLAAFANAQRSTPVEVRSFLNRIAAMGGLALITVASLHVATHWSNTDWRQTGLSFLQPLALTVAAVAVTAVVTIVAAYEVALAVALRYPLVGSSPAIRHRVALIFGLKFDLKKVATFGGAVSVRLRQAESFASALAVVRAYRDGHIGPTDWPGIATTEM